MTQTELNDIWNQLVTGKAVENFGGAKSDSLDVLTQHTPHRLWARTDPMKPWDELRRMGEGKA